MVFLHVSSSCFSLLWNILLSQASALAESYDCTMRNDKVKLIYSIGLFLLLM